MENMKELIKSTIVEMIKDGDLQFETTIKNRNYGKRIVTKIYHCPEFGQKELIQMFKEDISSKVF
ncbi:RNA-binding protein [Robertmurraya siralis]|uniref:hypothetical protein n=1 Tax=Robertmurraya siralis TaxID=77777 RepID=UPI0010F8C9C4|nr:hypothetical protein [Robertmurraya siralis]